MLTRRKCVIEYQRVIYIISLFLFLLCKTSRYMLTQDTMIKYTHFLYSYTIKI